MAFYRHHATASMPAPSVQVLGRALDAGRLLIVEPPAGGPLLASSAIFDFTPDGCRSYVGELSGTRVTPRLNGFGPVGVQRLLLGARLLNHAAAEGDVAPGFSTTLITIVRSDNRKSLANVVAAGFEPLHERPDWFGYEELA